MGPGVDEQILVVDDDAELRSLLMLILRGEGHSVSEATDTAGALSLIGSGGIALVVLDISLGDEDGQALLGPIRAISDVPVLLISGTGDDPEQVLQRNRGATDYLPKPFSPSELVARVRSALGCV